MYIIFAMVLPSGIEFRGLFLVHNFVCVEVTDAKKH